MKTLSLTVSRLKNYFKTQPLIFTIYIIGSVACIITFIYFFGNGVAYKANSIKNDILYRTYSISLYENHKIDIQGIQMLQSGEETYISVYTPISATSVNCDDMLLNDTEYYLICSVYPDNKIISLKRGKSDNLTYNDVVVPTGFLISDRDFHTLNINKKILNITGESLLNDTFIVNNEYFCDNFNVLYIEILLPEILSDVKNKDYTNLLREKFPNADIVDPSVYRQKDTNDSIKNIGYLSVLFLICFFTFSLLIQYVMEKNNTENMIYRVVGASKFKMCYIILIDNFIIILISLLISIVFHVSFYDTLFVDINIYNSLIYECTDYIYISLLVLVLSEIPIVFIIKNYNKNSIIQSVAEFNRGG